ncbi:hypothetical protein [Emticicia sp. BO119]|uniref:hypothetical protein n=1 Tax=Emticicia sp. BO119 TaxID=2757768 RepID=UPI0015F0C71A|nr:hypothetical protein [Emticicia sp. BO119]MBA4852089.1 hypothetical protein [Emticicia sp. BO119]
MELQNLDKEMVNFLTEKPFPTEIEGTNLTYRRAIVLAALAPVSEKETDEKKFNKYMLATKIQKEEKPDLSTVEVAEIRAGSTVQWPAVVHGALVEYLESQASKK